MAGMTKSPQLRLSPETAKTHETEGGWAAANDGATAARVSRVREAGSLNMHPAYREARVVQINIPQQEVETGRVP
jgi:hypothetical protein